MAKTKAKEIPTVPPKKSDEFLDPASERDYVDDVRAAVDEAILEASKADPWLAKFSEWEGGIDPETGRFRESTLVECQESEPLVLVPYNAKAKPRQEGYRSAEVAKESIIFDPRIMGVPNGTASRIARYRAETSGSHASLYGQSVVGLGNTNLQELWRVASWMLLHNPFAANVVRSLTFLTIGEGPKISWPGARTSGARKEKAWEAVEKTVGFRKKLRRLVKMTFGLGDVFAHPIVDDRRSARRRGAPPVKRGVPNRLLLLEPDRVSEVWVNELDTEDVYGYEIAPNTTRERTILPPEQVVHSRVGDFGNVARGISVLLPAMKYLRFAEMFVESRHWLNQVRARVPIVRKIRGAATAIQQEKLRLRKLPPYGTVALEGDNASWEMPELKVQAADAVDDFVRLLLCVGASTGLPLYMVANDPSSGTYAGQLVAESPTVRMILEYREQIGESVDDLVRILSGEDDGWRQNYPPVLRRAIGESAAAFRTLVESEIVSRRTACEEMGKEWEGEDGERVRIMRERGEGFGESLLPFGDEGDEPAASTAGDEGTAPGEGSEELPNEREKKPKTGVALGKTGSSMPRNSAV